MIEINLARAKELLAESIADRGADYVYPASVCTYIHVAGEKKSTTHSVDGEYSFTPEVDEPGCGVGDAMIKGGVPMSWFKAGETFDDDGASMVTNNNGDVWTLAKNLQEQGEARMTPRAAAYLKAFQAKQDGGVPWGESRDHADGMDLSDFPDEFTDLDGLKDADLVFYHMF